MSSTGIYRSIVVELERKRLAMGISMDMMSELMGVAERSYAKMIWPDAPSGRQASWDKLQKAVDVLWDGGFDVAISKGDTAPEMGPGTRRLIRQSAAHYDRRTQRELMRDLSKLAIEGRKKKIPLWKVRKIARKAARARGRQLKQQAKARRTTPRCGEHENGGTNATHRLRESEHGRAIARGAI